MQRKRNMYLFLSTESQTHKLPPPFAKRIGSMWLLASYFKTLLRLSLCCYMQRTFDWEFSHLILNA